MRGSKLNQAFSAQVFRTQNCMHLLHSICQIHCMITYLCVCTKMHVRVLAYGCIFAWVCACAYTFACVLSCVHACVYVCVRARTCVNARACTFSHVRVFLCVHLCTQVRVHVCVRVQGCMNCRFARVRGWVHAHLREECVCRFCSCIISSLENFSGVGLHALLILRLSRSWCCCF